VLVKAVVRALVGTKLQLPRPNVAGMNDSTARSTIRLPGANRAPEPTSADDVVEDEPEDDVEDTPDDDVEDTLDDDVEDTLDDDVEETPDDDVEAWVELTHRPLSQVPYPDGQWEHGTPSM